MTHRIALFSLICATAFSADFTTYIGDSHAYQVTAIATDSAGSTYVTGSRVIAPNSTDVFVTKLDSSGAVVFTATFGGKALDQANAIALDASGNIWVGGRTSSNNFPLHDALQTDFGMDTTGFLVKLAPDGSVIYSSYFGGTLSVSSVNGVATDQSGNLCVTGTTNSSDFPITAGMPAGKVTTAFSMAATSGAFIAKLSPNGLQILYSGVIVGNTPVCAGGSSCFLSDRFTSGVGISVDSAGNAYIAGNTNTNDLPVTSGAYNAAGYGAFGAKINAAGNGLAYLTYLGPYAGIVSFGPSESITTTAITIDASGNAYLAGYTNDPEFPATAGAFQTSLGGLNSGQNSNDGFVAKLNAGGTAVVWASYLGGPLADQGNSIAIDPSGNVWSAGVTAGGFPSLSAGVTNGPGDGTEVRWLGP
jgi:beta-propeller repeat-containing protein